MSDCKNMLEEISKEEIKKYQMNSWQGVIREIEGLEKLAIVDRDDSADEDGSNHDVFWDGYIKAIDEIKEIIHSKILFWKKLEIKELLNLMKGETK